MKILFVSQYFYPEPFRTTTIAKRLVDLGHEVDVYCQVPSYPIGKRYKGYSHKEKRNEIFEGMVVRRSFSFVRTQNMFLRFFNYYSFPHFAKKDLRKNKKEYDVVFSIQLTPVMGIEPAIYFAKKHNLKLVVYSMDMWPASILTGGIKKNGLIYKYFQRKSKKIYGAIDSLIVSSEPHINYIHELLETKKKISYLPQFSNEQETKWCPDIKNPHIVWTGNIGKAQDLKTVLLAAKELEQENVTFDIVGDGLEYTNYKKMASSIGIKNVIFHGRKSPEELRPILAHALAGLVSSSLDEVSKLTLPGKVQTYLKHGLPIIAASTGATNDLVKKHNCGYTCESGDFKALSQNIKKIISSTPEELSLISTNSKNLYYSKMDISYFIDFINQKLNENSR